MDRGNSNNSEMHEITRGFFIQYSWNYTSVASSVWNSKWPHNFLYGRLLSYYSKSVAHLLKLEDERAEQVESVNRAHKAYYPTMHSFRDPIAVNMNL